MGMADKFLFFWKKGGSDMSVIDGVKEWLFRKALKKGVVRAGVYLASYIVAILGRLGLEQYGIAIEIDPRVLEASITGALVAGLEMFRNYLKVKKGWNVL